MIWTKCERDELSTEEALYWIKNGESERTNETWTTGDILGLGSVGWRKGIVEWEIFGCLC